MSPKTRVAIANTAIVTASLVGGALITNDLTASNGGLLGAFGIEAAAPKDTATPTIAAETRPDQTVTGAAIDYEYGTVQLEVVRTNGKISAVNLVQAGANDGREAAFPYLQQYAIEAQGTNFSNLSGATYTTDAFKLALESAISKLS